MNDNTLYQHELERIHAWWRAANYLSAGQIFLMDNPLLEEPLKPEHIKPRRLGHWGTTPGLNLLYAHMNRVIRKFDLNAIFVTGPGHGGPALVASTWLEGTYSERYPNVSQDREGMKRLFRQFSRCPPWRAKRRRVVPGSREATRDTRRAEGAKGDPKGASERGVQSYGRPVCSRNELAMLWRNAGLPGRPGH